MNRGLIAKTLREQLGFTLVIALGLVVVELVLAHVLPRFQKDLSEQMMRLPFLQTMLKALLGVDVSGGLGTQLILSLAWVHPVVLALVWAHAIISGTRVPAGEVDRATVDILLGLPVTRWGALAAETVVAAGAAVFIVGCAVGGHVLGGMGLPESERLPLERLPLLASNLVALYLAVAGVSYFVSAFCDRRGRAAGGAVGIVLASFLLNYLAQFWEPAQKVAFLGVLDYYRPADIVRTGAWPVRGLAVLLGAGAAFWIGAGVVFSRRDLCTV